mgnify:FL=1
MGNELRRVLTEEDKAYILKNREKESVKEMSKALGISERRIRDFLFYHKLEYQKVCQHYRRTLTDRENEIMELVSRGLNNEEIGAKLCISVNTVRTHIKNIYQKYGLTSYGKEKAVFRVRAVLRYQQGSD